MDAALEIFKKKAASFEQETLPLVEYYRQKKIPVITIDVKETTSPREMVEAALK